MTATRPDPQTRALRTMTDAQLSLAIGDALNALVANECRALALYAAMLGKVADADAGALAEGEGR